MGMDRGRGAAQGELGMKVKGIFVGSDVERGAEGKGKGTPRRRRGDGGTPEGAVPTGTVATTVLVAVAITETVVPGASKVPEFVT